MKHKIVVGVVMASTMISLSSLAQYVPNRAKTQAVQRPKAQLFTSLPESFSIDVALLSQLFEMASGDKVRLPVNASQFIDGVVAEKATKNELVTSLNIRMTNFAGALLSLSRIAKPGQPVNYIGRIINIKYGDAFLLKKRNDQFLFIKSAQSQVLPD